jgi:hypothetical protein
MHLGDRNPGSVIDFKFNTLRDDTGAPITLAGTPVVKVYKANGTTESTAGVTLTTDFDALVGMHHVRIDTSIDAVFYAAGAEYDVVLTAGTVNAISKVGLALAHFALHQESALRVDSEVPGGASGGTVGGQLSRLGAGRVIVVSPVSPDANVTIVQGDDYATADGTALEWVNEEGDWPNLTAATIEVKVGNAAPFTGAVVTPTGPGQKVTLDLDATETGALGVGFDRYWVRATLASTGVVTLAKGRWRVTEPQSPT